MIYLSSGIRFFVCLFPRFPLYWTYEKYDQKKNLAGDLQIAGQSLPD